MDKRIPIDLLIFDLDGTLVDSLKDIVLTANYTLRQLDLNKKSKQQIATYIGYGIEGFTRDLLGEKNLSLYDQALRLFEKRYRLTMFEHTRLMPGAKTVLQYFAKRKKTMVLITNKKRTFARKQLVFFKIERYFKEILGGDDVDCLKPSACPIDLMVNKYRFKRKRCAIIGDMSFDIEAGEAAGIISCALTNGIGLKKDLVKTKPDFVINSLRELTKIFS